MKKLIVILVILVGATQLMAQEFRASYTGVEDVKLTTGSGDVEIVKSSNASVEVVLVHEMGADYSPDIRQNGDNLIIRDGDKRMRGKIAWTITVPDDLSVNITTGSGDISVSGLKVDLKTINGSGDVDISNVQGNVNSNTGSGDLSISDFDGEFKGNTGSGDAEIESASGIIAVNCGSGDIEIDDSNVQISANVGSGTIEITNLVMAGECSFNSGSGDVEVSLGATPAYDLSMNSGSGDATLDRNNHSISALVEMTASKKNGDIVAPFDFDKEEEIDRDGYIQVRKTVTLGNGDVKIAIGTGSGVARIK